MDQEFEMDKIVILEDVDGNQIEMLIEDYMFYEGKEYVILVEKGAEDDENPEAVIMEVCDVESDDDMEEFLPVDEVLAQRIIDVYNASFSDEDFDDEEE